MTEAAAGAELSPCGRWRWRLWRRWGAGPPMVFVLLNPSTADACRDDPTLRRCMSIARAAGAGGVEIVNLFALRSPRPAALRVAADPVGPGCDAAILAAARSAGAAICGWGDGGALMGRGPAVAAGLRAEGVRLHHLGLTRAGAPRHPLYAPRGVLPAAWDQGGR